MLATFRKSNSINIESVKNEEEADFKKNLLSSGLAYKNGTHIKLNSYGLLAKKIGFSTYFELEKLEKKWIRENSKSKLFLMNLVIFILVGSIIFLIWLILP